MLDQDRDKLCHRGSNPGRVILFNPWATYQLLQENMRAIHCDARGSRGIGHRCALVESIVVWQLHEAASPALAHVAWWRGVCASGFSGSIDSEQVLKLAGTRLGLADMAYLMAPLLGFQFVERTL